MWISRSKVDLRLYSTKRGMFWYTEDILMESFSHPDLSWHKRPPAKPVAPNTVPNKIQQTGHAPITPFSHLRPLATHERPGSKGWVQTTRIEKKILPENLLVLAERAKTQRLKLEKHREALQATLKPLEEELQMALNEISAGRHLYTDKQGHIHRGIDSLQYDIIQFAKKHKIQGLLNKQGKLSGTESQRQMAIIEVMRKLLLVSPDESIRGEAANFLDNYTSAYERYDRAGETIRTIEEKKAVLQKGIDEMTSNISLVQAEEQRYLEKHQSMMNGFGDLLAEH